MSQKTQTWTGFAYDLRNGCRTSESLGGQGHEINSKRIREVKFRFSGNKRGQMVQRRKWNNALLHIFLWIRSFCA